MQHEKVSNVMHNRVSDRSLSYLFILYILGVFLLITNYLYIILWCIRHMFFCFVLFVLNKWKRWNPLIALHVYHDALQGVPWNCQWQNSFLSLYIYYWFFLFIKSEYYLLYEIGRTRLKSFLLTNYLNLKWILYFKLWLKLVEMINH
jgi:hypothetical protein